MEGETKRTVLAYMYLSFCLCFDETNGDIAPQIIVSDWTQCDVHENVFLTLWDLSVRRCLLECNARKHCKAWNFMRHVNKCELLETDLHDAIDMDKNMCLYVRKEENAATYPIHSLCTSCLEGLVCELPSGNCVKKECGKLNVSNAIVAGNINNIGSVVQILPETGYSLGEQSSRSVCLSNGSWDNIPVPEREDHCDSGWHHSESTRSCYLEVHTPRNYAAATSHCTSLGGHLVYIESVLENTLVQQFLSQSSASSSTRWWIGVTEVANVWVYTGTTDPITFSNWNPGEPNNQLGIEICVERQTSGWNDGNCYWGRYSICEKSAIADKK